MSPETFKIAVRMTDGALRAIPGSFASWSDASYRAKQYLGACVVSRSGFLVAVSQVSDTHFVLQLGTRHGHVCQAGSKWLVLTGGLGTFDSQDAAFAAVSNLLDRGAS